jgi:hypothetical protein
MTLTADRFRALARSLHPGRLSVVDAEAIVGLAQLAVDADGREDQDEITTFFTIGKVVFGIAGIAEVPTPTFAEDEDDLDLAVTLSARLGSTASRELAYAVVYLLVMVDVTIATEEAALVERLLTTLAITPERAAELVTMITAATVA